jgi:hypothetical protein
VLQLLCDSESQTKININFYYRTPNWTSTMCECCDVTLVSLVDGTLVENPPLLATIWYFLVVQRLMEAGAVDVSQRNN